MTDAASFNPASTTSRISLLGPSVSRDLVEPSSIMGSLTTMRAFVALALLIVLGGLRPADATPAVFWCFFVKGSTALTLGRCPEIVAEFAAVWRGRQAGTIGDHPFLDGPTLPPVPMRVTIYGHAQDGGAGASDDRLSVQRAAAVARELERLRIPRDMIDVVGLGASKPMVPTEAPENRFVEMVFHSQGPR